MINFNYKVIFSRRRSMSIIVNPDKGVTVRAPYRTSLKAIDEYVQSKAGWIMKHLERFTELKRIRNGKQYIEGEPHMFLGREYFLRLTKSDLPFVNLKTSTIEIGINDPSDTLRVKSYLESWYRKMADEIFNEKLSILSTKFDKQNLNPAKLTVRSLKSRWGSCSSKGRITLNVDLIKLDSKYSDYVITHELCHLRHHNHGREFYMLLSELYPDWRRVRSDLRKYIR